jgi:pilus assembly protein CpaF
MSSVDADVHARLLRRAGPGREPVARDQIAALVRAADPLLTASDVELTTARVDARLSGLGALQPLLSDDAVTDILVNGPGVVWVERAGRLTRTAVVLDRHDIDLILEQVVAPLGRRIDPSSPMVDARLADGSRLHAVVPPIAVDGPCIAIRRFAVRPVPLDAIASAPVADLLRWAVRAGANLVVSGATGSGKTTLLDALGAEIGPGERIVTVEDAAELRLPSDHVVRLEARAASPDGAGAIEVRELVRNALRMRPDRLVIGETRGAEAFDLVQAMNTGHDGCLATVHANSADDAVRRIETLVLLAGVGLPAGAIRDHLAAALDLVVHVERGADGARRVAEVAEVLEPARGDTASMVRTRRLADRSVVLCAPSRGHRRPSTAPFEVKP